MNYKITNKLRILCWQIEGLLKEDGLSSGEKMVFGNTLHLIEKIAEREEIDLHPTP